MKRYVWNLAVECYGEGACSDDVSDRIADMVGQGFTNGIIEVQEEE